jgi:hypothetical protein
MGRSGGAVGQPLRGVPRLLWRFAAGALAGASRHARCWELQTLELQTLELQTLELRTPELQR